MSEQARINVIKKRWRDERKITGKDVEFLIRRAEAAEAMAAARSLKRDSGLDDLFGSMFGGHR